MSQAADPPNDDAPLDPQVERLVAYLDGELPPAEGERFESELVDDPAARSRLEDLGRVWNALDALPRATAPASFTQSTVEMAATSGARPRGNDESPPPRGWIGVGLMLAGVAASLGWLLTVGLSGALDRRDLVDLPAALHATALEEATSIDFLRRLSRRGGRLIDAYADEPRTFDAEDWATVQQPAIAPRRVWLDQRSPAEIAELSDRVARFRALSPSRQAALREQAAAIAQDRDAGELRRVALAYESALSRLPASQRASLREMPDAERIAALTRGVARELIRAADLRLTDEEAERLLAAFDRAPTGRRAVRDRFAEFFGGGRLPESPIDRFALMTTVVANAPDRLPPGREEQRDAVFRLWGAYADRLAEALPDRVRGELDRNRSKRDHAADWLIVLREASPRDAESVFTTRLSNDEISRALLLPRDRFNESLAEQVAPPLPPAPPVAPGGGLRPPRDAPFGPPGGWQPGRRGPPPPRGDRRGPPR
ncbi:MAG: hypothetical protein AAF805_03875 [Planctomycetota bacterium]